jgi:flagellar protein FlbD
LIRATRLNDEAFYINSDLIEFVEETPDTILSMASGRKFVVRESVETIVDEIVAFRRRIYGVSPEEHEVT